MDKILEAMISIMLVASLLIVILDERTNVDEDLSNSIHQIQASILTSIQLNSSLRGEVMSANNLPINWTDFDSSGLSSTKQKIDSKIPPYLNCEVKLCDIEDSCVLGKSINKEIFVHKKGIFVEGSIYSPRQLKMFCWD